MARKPRDVTDAELAILQVLWERGEVTVRDLVEQLYPAGTPSDLATVQKLLKRLEDKGCLGRNRSLWPHRFRAAIQRDELILRRLQSTADDLCAGSLTPVLTHLVHSQQLTAGDRDTLRQLLSELDTKGSSKKRQ
ncbi:MAG: BlaI/MecI/CopY family transcriptional regulator [Planctomycetaceae bacterium]